MTLLEQALTAHRAGLCVMPPREDGSKAPETFWKEYQSRTSDETEVRRWYTSDRGGLGVICGATSGNFEVLEFEGRAVAEGLWTAYKEQAEASGVMPVLDRVMRGYGVRSPSGGIHLGYRCWEGVAGNSKLASRPATAEELARDPTEGDQTLIETRGEGGFIVTPPSNGRVHPSGGAYSWLAGGFETVVEISGEEREQLLALARGFDQTPRQEWQAPLRPREQAKLEGRPGDDFNARGDWAHHVLEPAGWSRTGRQGGREYWYRKRDGRKGWKSAAITADQHYLYVFSTSTELPHEVGLSKFRAYAFLHHEGDFAGAARQLRSEGYGSEPEASPAVAETGGGANGAAAVEVASEEKVTPLARTEPWPRPLERAAFHGLVGRVSELIDPYVESNQASVLVQFLAAFGVAAGLRPHLMVGATRHAPVTYVGLVGATSMGRKGTAWDPVETLFKLAEPAFANRIMSGIGSGERLVWLVRDPTLDSKGALSDPGAGDRRLLLQEPELARMLAVVNREGSTLSAYLRSAYDGKPLRNEVKSQGSVASLHHIGLIGHCTAEELRSELSETQVRNGLANRLTWVLARREKKLPEPPVFEGQDIDEMARELGESLERARVINRMERSVEARRLWKDWYLTLPDEAAGLGGAITARGPAQVTRFSVIYALAEGSSVIGEQHMEAALALWNYSLRCVHYIWGGGTGDVMADRIFEELAYGPLTMTQLYRDVFSGNTSGPVLERAVRLLESRHLAARERVSSPGRGRPALRVRRTT